RADQRAQPAQDIYSFGRLLTLLAGVVEDDPRWLLEAAEDCLAEDPVRRPRAADLIPRLSPDWDLQVEMLRGAGWQPEQQLGLIGRDFIRRDFEAYARTCADHGGLFLIEGPSGVGKTALLTDWHRLLGSPVGFYFRYRDDRVQATAMLDSLSEQLARHFRLEP